MFKLGVKNIRLGCLFPSLGVAKPEDGRPAVGVAGSDVTAPPSKELPPSPGKKARVGARGLGWLLLL